MKFAVASDLHFEFQADRGATLVQELPNTETIVVAGDLADSFNLCDGLRTLLKRYAHVVFVCGNHEFYGSSLRQVRHEISTLSKEQPGLHFLDNSTCTIDGQRFVGTTMWIRHVPGIEARHRYMSDFSYIVGSDLIYKENEKAREFLEDTVTSTDVVVTHHLPSQRSVHPKYKGSHLNCFFVCNVEPLLTEKQPKLWIHGHTHETCDYLVGSTRVLCNPFGYATHETNRFFQSDLVVDV